MCLFFNYIQWHQVKELNETYLKHNLLLCNPSVVKNRIFSMDGRPKFTTASK